jgi:hypothetical protein
MKIAAHIRLTPAGLQAATSPSQEKEIMSNSYAVAPIKLNLLEPYFFTLFSCCYAMIPGKSLGWERNYVSYYD